MNEFERDDAWQRGVRDRLLAPQFYGRYAYQGRYVVIDKGRLASFLQRRLAVDTIVQGREGAAICIEEKIVRWKGKVYSHLCLETRSCTVPGRESDGWMRYGKADYLLYCCAQDEPCTRLVCYLIDFPKLQAWFNPREAQFPVFRMGDTINKTVGRLAPIKAIQKAVPSWSFRCEPDALDSVA